MPVPDRTPEVAALPAYRRVMADATKFYVETRCDGFPWTREGCNAHGPGTSFIPWPDRAAAEAAVEARLRDREQFDDPMWGTAEYRVVPARG